MCIMSSVDTTVPPPPPTATSVTVVQTEKSGLTKAETDFIIFWYVTTFIAVVVSIVMVSVNKDPRYNSFWGGGVAVAMIFGPFYFIQLGVGINDKKFNPSFEDAKRELCSAQPSTV